MKIDLQDAIEAAEAMLERMRDLDGTEINDASRGRAAREQRTEISMSLQMLAHQADVLRVTLTGAHLGLRDRGRDRQDPVPGPGSA